MNVNPCIWDRLRQLVVVLLFLAGLLGVVVWYLPLIRQNERMRQKIMHYRMQIAHEEERSKQMENSIRALRTDPKALERLAREKLGYVKPGETRIQFESASTNHPAGR